MDIMRSAIQVSSLPFLLCIAMSGLAQQAKTNASAEWQYVKEDDPLHAKTRDRFILEGTYLTPPRLSTNGSPTVVVECSDGRVEHNYFSVHAVVARTHDNLPDGFEVRVDGKSRTFFVDSISTDGQGLFFTRIDLKEMLYAKRVIVGVNEYLGPQVVMQFDIPDPSPVMEKCGADSILKRSDRINKKGK